MCVLQRTHLHVIINFRSWGQTSRWNVHFLSDVAVQIVSQSKSKSNSTSVVQIGTYDKHYIQVVLISDSDL